MFNFLKKKKSPEEQVQEISDEIKTNYTQKSVKLTVTDIKPALTDSKIGGIPYWTGEKDWPVDSNGKKMQLLAQINFAQIARQAGKIPLLPSDGLLQFFIPSIGSNYGLNVSNPVNNPDFKVIFHDSIDSTIPEEKVISDFIDFEPENGSSPVCEPSSLTAELADSVIQETDAGFNDAFAEIWKKVTGNDADGEPADCLDDESFANGSRFSRDFFKQLKNSGSRILGYPYFCQGDPRGIKAGQSPVIFDTLLLQLDSAGSKGRLEFGDSGICQIFINSAALQNKDFSKILYNWDCD